MTSSQYGSYIQGCTRATMAGTEGSQTARLSRSRKPVPVRIGCLQLDSMKPESLVKAYQLRRLEYVPGPCRKPVSPEVRELTRKGGSDLRQGW